VLVEFLVELFALFVLLVSVHRAQT
jgi:hypothetical protein